MHPGDFSPAQVGLVRIALYGAVNPGQSLPTLDQFAQVALSLRPSGIRGPEATAREMERAKGSYYYELFAKRREGKELKLARGGSGPLLPKVLRVRVTIPDAPEKKAPVEGNNHSGKVAN